MKLENATEYEPLRVHIMRDDTKAATVPDKRKTYHVISKTYLAGAPELILGRSAKRCQATIAVIASQVSSQPPLVPLVLQASGTNSYNNNPYDVFVTVQGGTVSAISANGTNTNQTSGTFYVPAGTKISVTYTVAPTTFTTTPTNVVSNLVVTSPVILADNESDAGNAQRWTQNGTVPGAVLQPGQVVRVYHSDEIWLASIGANTPALVSVIAEYET